MNKSRILAKSDYYPFGLTFNSYNKAGMVAQKYSFNSKEKQNELGLNWLDYGARMMDPALGRWHAVDPMAHKFANFSPYNYAVDNPIMFIDPDGMYTYNWQDKRYEDDDGNEVSWDTVKSDIDSKSESTNVLVTGKNRTKKDGSTDWALEGVALQAEVSSLKIIQADHAKDAYSQMKSIVDDGGTIGNVIFDSHGSYGAAGFKIGNGGWINNQNGNLNNHWVRSIGELFSEDTEVLLLACHAGAAHNGGDKLLQNLSNSWGGRTVYGSHSWTGAKPGIFTGLVSPSYSPEPGSISGRNKAYQNIGGWTKASGRKTSVVNGSMYIKINGAFESGTKVNRRKSAIQGASYYNHFR